MPPHRHASHAVSVGHHQTARPDAASYFQRTSAASQQHQHQQDTAGDSESAASLSRSFSSSRVATKGETDRGSFYCSGDDPICCSLDEEEVSRRPRGSPSTAAEQQRLQLRPSPELGASAPSHLQTGVGLGVLGCSNPLAHNCAACKQKKLVDDVVEQKPPNHLASEDMVVPRCSLSSTLHTIVHVCDCMSPFELDRALAVENLRLERVRDAHAVVLMMAKRYGLDRVLEDADLVLIVYKYDEMMRMYTMMGAPVSYRRKQSYFHRVSSSLIPESPSARRRKTNCPSNEEVQFDPLIWQETSQDPAFAAPGHRELDERLRDAMRQQFSLHALGTLTSAHVPPADESWHLAVHEPNGLKIFFRRHASSTLLSFRVEGTVDACILNIISVLNEMDLYKEWIPYYSFPVK